MFAAYEEAKNKVNEQVKQTVQNAPQQLQGVQTVEGKTVQKEETPFR